METGAGDIGGILLGMKRQCAMYDELWRAQWVDTKDSGEENAVPPYNGKQKKAQAGASPKGQTESLPLPEISLDETHEESRETARLSASPGSLDIESGMPPQSKLTSAATVPKTAEEVDADVDLAFRKLVILSPARS